MKGHSLLLSLAGLLTAGAAASADEPDPTKQVAAEEEAKRLEGAWEVVYCEQDGKADPERTGTRVVFAPGLMRMGDDTELPYRVDPRIGPRRIDAEVHPRSNRGDQ